MKQPHGGPTVTLADGVDMPLLGFGTWQAEDDAAYDAVRTALDAGYRHIDTATLYGNEEQVGRAVRDSGIPRADVFITTKLGPNQAGQERQTIEGSLRALGTDYVDLWLVHWPPGGEARPETWQEFLAVQRDGLTRAIGVSNYSTEQIDELIDAAGQAPSVNQIPWSPARYDSRILAECRARGIVVEGYSPLKNTDLNAPVLVETAQAHGVTPVQVVLRWHVDHGVVVIPKSVTPDRIRSNFDIFGFSLSSDELTRIDAMSSR